MKNSTWEAVARGKDEIDLDPGEVPDEFGTARFKLPGGWMFHHWIWSAKTGQNIATMRFVPDPDHTWEI